MELREEIEAMVLTFEQYLRVAMLQTEAEYFSTKNWMDKEKQL